MEVPERIGRYKIQKEVGQGGMSVVYQATDVTLGREVAIKVLHPHLARRDDYQRRFQREARAVARLRHPNILEIYDYSGTESEQAYIVTQFIHGITLRDLAEEHGPLLPEFTAMLGLKLAAALDHAHSMGVIHRDIKPENVMVSSNGTVVLMDFGLAQLRDTEQGLTLTGTVMGSPAHMSPEHILGKELDERADIFSLGTLLYLLCTGKFPFDAPNAQALFMKILNSDCEPAAMVHPPVGDGFSRIIATAMAREPEDRYQSAAELKRDLEHYLSDLDMLPYQAQLRRFLHQPGPVTIETENILVTKLLNRGTDELAAHQLIQAISIGNRLAAMRPDDPGVQELLDSIRTFGTRRRLRKLAITAGSILLVSLVTIFSLYMVFQPGRHPGREGEHLPSPAVADADTGQPHREMPTPGALAQRPASPPVEQAAPAPGTTPPAPTAPDGEADQGVEPPSPATPTPAPHPATPATHSREPGPADSTPREPPAKDTTGPHTKQEPARAGRSTSGSTAPTNTKAQPSTQSGRSSASGVASAAATATTAGTGITQMAWVQIRSYPYTNIWVDDREVGTSTINKGVHLPPGKHRITLRNPGCYPHEQTVTVHRDGTATPSQLTVRLKWLPAQLRVPGPPGGEVYLDNKPLGKTGPAPFPVPMFGPAKKATVRIQQDVEVLWAAEIQLRPGETSTITP